MRIYKIWPKQKNNNKALYYCCSFFLTLTPFSRLFPGQLWKIAGQISRLFQEFKTLYKPWNEGGIINNLCMCIKMKGAYPRIWITCAKSPTQHFNSPTWCKALKRLKREQICRCNSAIRKCIRPLKKVS